MPKQIDFKNLTPAQIAAIKQADAEYMKRTTGEADSLKQVKQELDIDKLKSARPTPQQAKLDSLKRELAIQQLEAQLAGEEPDKLSAEKLRGQRFITQQESLKVEEQKRDLGGVGIKPPRSATLSELSTGKKRIEDTLKNMSTSDPGYTQMIEMRDLYDAEILRRLREMERRGSARPEPSAPDTTKKEPAGMSLFGVRE